MSKAERLGYAIEEIAANTHLVDESLRGSLETLLEALIAPSLSNAGPNHSSACYLVSWLVGPDGEAVNNTTLVSECMILPEHLF